MLVLTVFPSATRTSLFSDAITYRFRIRPMTIACVGAAPAYVVGADEHAFDFTFAASSAGNDTDAATASALGGPLLAVVSET